jgi:hypothetical protein
MNPGDFGEVSYEVSVANSANSNRLLHTPCFRIPDPFAEPTTTLLTYALCLVLVP